MASAARTIPMAPSSQSLLAKLAAILPKDTEFKVYHLSTPPTKTASLYSAPPGIRPDRTYCENHFLSVSIRPPQKDDAERKDVLIFAIEILIYSTAHDTTFFVSKADSTGFLHLLGLPKGTPSPIRSVSVTFLDHLLEQHRRPNIRSIVSLFARAQDQYLFPGSVEYRGKHVLDDRGLVKWWCRVLDPLIEDSKKSDDTWNSVHGYLIVPGLDTYETSSYHPRKSGVAKSWTVGHPLKQISRHGADVPPRCLIPHYPDDPKARFLDELDDEITKGKTPSSGQWKSVKTVDQFWEMMAFRQECSAGRLVGFIWIVFEPPQQAPSSLPANDSQSTAFTDNNSQVWDGTSSQDPSPATSFYGSSQIGPESSAKDQLDKHTQATSSSPQKQTTSSSDPKRKTKKKKKLTGPIVPREPRIKTSTKSQLPSIPENTSYYLWRPTGRGQVVVDETDYKRITELLLRLDFANLELATSSTTRWVSEVRNGASGEESERWGATVVGTKITEVKSQDVPGGVQTLNIGLVRKKRKSVDDGKDGQTAAAAVVTPPPAVNVLSAGMIRKKAKA